MLHGVQYNTKKKVVIQTFFTRYHLLLVLCFLLMLALLLPFFRQEDLQRANVDSIPCTISYYGRRFQGNLTANGERYNMYELTAASRTLPFNTLVHITNLKNNKEVTVRINDRGPYVDTITLDVSYEAARKLDFVQDGLARVIIKILGKKKV